MTCLWSSARRRWPATPCGRRRGAQVRPGADRRRSLPDTYCRRAGGARTERRLGCCDQRLPRLEVGWLGGGTGDGGATCGPGQRPEHRPSDRPEESQCIDAALARTRITRRAARLRMPAVGRRYTESKSMRSATSTNSSSARLPATSAASVGPTHFFGCAMRSVHTQTGTRASSRRVMATVRGS